MRSQRRDVFRHPSEPQIRTRGVSGWDPADEPESGEFDDVNQVLVLFPIVKCIGGHKTRLKHKYLIYIMKLPGLGFV